MAFLSNRWGGAYGMRGHHAHDEYEWMVRRVGGGANNQISETIDIKEDECVHCTVKNAPKPGLYLHTD